MGHISVDENNIEETISTLRCAGRVAKIENHYPDWRKSTKKSAKK